jgi:uncharacterized protein YkwD
VPYVGPNFSSGIELRCAAALLSCAILACSTPGSPETPSSSPIAADVIKLTNAERARRRVPPLASSPRLMRAANIHAEQMARAGRLDHELPRAKYPRAEDRLKAAKYAWRAWAENVAFGPRDADGVMRVWMQSTGHRANILSTSVTEIGVGHAKDKQGRMYWVQVFGRPAS